MTKSRWLFFVLPLAIFFSCTTGKQLTDVKDTAQSNFNAGNYAEALSGYESIIANYESQKKSAECPVYSQAGISAMNLDQTGKALDYLKKATYTPFADENTYAAMAGLYRNIDNLSLEIETLEEYLQKYPAGAEIDQMKMRLFKTYVESENWQQAFDLWPDIEPQVKMGINYLEDYYQVNKALENEEMVEELAGQLLDMNDENIMGLEFMARKYYNIAENHYQVEMEAYEKNKTRKQYARLIKALDEVTREFQTALGYFETLYKINPLPVYANYMGNIYIRFNDQEKADYYHELGSEK
jgi:tetratricopeptide (TPR) repeat protein